MSMNATNHTSAQCFDLVEHTMWWGSLEGESLIKSGRHFIVQMSYLWGMFECKMPPQWRTQITTMFETLEFLSFH